MFFKKFPKPEENQLNDKRFSTLSFEVSELYRTLKQLEQRINNIEIDMRYLQGKFKDKIFKKPETDENNKKEVGFLNPYGNPI